MVSPDKQIGSRKGRNQPVMYPKLRVIAVILSQIHTATLLRGLLRGWHEEASVIKDTDITVRERVSAPKLSVLFINFVKMVQCMYTSRSIPTHYYILR